MPVIAHVADKMCTQGKQLCQLLSTSGCGLKCIEDHLMRSHIGDHANLHRMLDVGENY